MVCFECYDDGGGERRSGRKTCGARFEPTVESGSATESTKAEQASKGGEAARKRGAGAGATSNHVESQRTD